MKPSILATDIRSHIDEIGAADVIVGIPSFNNARTIGHVVNAAVTGHAKYFPDLRMVLVNSDGGSTDGTPDVVARAELGGAQALLLRRDALPVRKVITAYQGIPGKGSAFRTIFEIAQRLNARACVVVDSDLRSITPEWFELLLGPVLHDGFDYVAPLYSRHKYDGTITNAIVYPLVRSLYGARIRQPIGGDFGFSGALAKHFLEHDVWETDVARFGIDIWMTTTALVGGYKVCQSYLGAKIHDAKDPGAHLSAMLMQVTGALFAQLEMHQRFWLPIRGSEPVPQFGFQYEVGLEPVPVQVGRMVHAFRQGIQEFAGIYQNFLSEATRSELEEIARQSDDAFHMPPEVWVRVVYEFAAAAHHRRLHRDHLLPTLTPLYLGRTASWVHQAAEFGSTEVEHELDALGRRFEEWKPWFVERWHEGRSAQ